MQADMPDGEVQLDTAGKGFDLHSEDELGSGAAHMDQVGGDRSRPAPAVARYASMMSGRHGSVPVLGSIFHCVLTQYVGRYARQYARQCVEHRMLESVLMVTLMCLERFLKICAQKYHVSWIHVSWIQHVIYIC